MRRGIAADAPLSDAGEERLSEEDRRGAAHRQGDADGRGEHAVLQRRQGGRRMVTVRRENTTCDIRGIGAYGIIVAQERNQVMDSGGTPGTNPKKERNRRRRFRDIGRALCRCSIIADRERCVNPSVCCVAGNRIGSQPSRFRAGRPEGAMEHNRSTTTFIFKASSHHGLSTPWWLLAAFSGMRRPWAKSPVCAIRNRVANQDARRSRISADRPDWTTWRYCGKRKLKGGDAAGGATA